MAGSRADRARGGVPEPLLSAFLASAESFNAHPVRFRAAWKANPRGHLTYAEWKRLDAMARKNHYPASHHSAEYEQSRQPAHRVLTADQAKSLLDFRP